MLRRRRETQEVCNYHYRAIMWPQYEGPRYFLTPVSGAKITTHSAGDVSHKLLIELITSTGFHLRDERGSELTKYRQYETI